MPGILPVRMATARTLIVDDHADVRFLIRAIVGDSGLPIEVVGEADGFEAAPFLPECRPGLPIVLCSAWVDDDVRERAAAAGIREVLSKDQFDAIVRLAGRGDQAGDDHG